ncbi:MAG: GMC family oxidoreductase [Pyrinomonadaceae bacterium]
MAALIETPTAETDFDVVIVGAGVAGALAAYRLAGAGKRVLLVDGGKRIPDSRDAYMQQFFLAMAKTPEAPYPNYKNAPVPLSLDVGNWQTEQALEKNLPGYQPRGYFIQRGNLPFSSTYERAAGGTTWHWLGTSLRLLPNDFKLQTTYGQGVDWPLSYEDLEPYYCRAEQEIGVAADTSHQNYLGITFGQDPKNPGTPYQYPMPEIPPSYLDQQLASSVGGMTFDGNPVNVSPTPQGRNSAPYDERRVCAGNTNCIPICPIQAKYDASIHVAKAAQLGATLMNRAIADKVLIDPQTGRVSGVHYIQYTDPNLPLSDATRGAFNEGVATARLYVIAAHAVETAKLLLNSRTDNQGLTGGVANRSDQVGRNLMDHPIQLSYALTANPVFPFRGPLSTSGIESLRDGAFRRTRSAFRIEVGNEGWNWATGDPYTTVNAFISPGQNSVSGPNHTVQGGLFGADLKNAVNGLITRQFRLGALCEQLPSAANRVTLSAQYTDGLGIPRPEMTYDLDDYTKAGYVAARKIALAIFQRMGARDLTYADPNSPSAFKFQDPNDPQAEETYILNGAGHLMGTYRMGTDPASSVVDRNQRAHDHDNLYLLGSGTFPTTGTANPTLTIAALALLAADAMIKQLG